MGPSHHGNTQNTVQIWSSPIWIAQWNPNLVQVTCPFSAYNYILIQFYLYIRSQVLLVTQNLMGTDKTSKNIELETPKHQKVKFIKTICLVGSEI